jgi:hypothetical protein
VRLVRLKHTPLLCQHVGTALPLSLVGHRSTAGMRMHCNRLTGSQTSSALRAGLQESRKQTLQIRSGLCQICGSGLSQSPRCRQSPQTGRQSSLAVECVQALERQATTESKPAKTILSANRGPSTSMQGPATWMSDVELPKYQQSLGKVELIVAGAGPSGLVVADRVSRAGENLNKLLYRSVSSMIRCLLAT